MPLTRQSGDAAPAIDACCGSRGAFRYARLVAIALAACSSGGDGMAPKREAASPTAVARAVAEDAGPAGNSDVGETRRDGAAGLTADAAVDAPAIAPVTQLEEMRAVGTANGDRARARALHSKALKVHRAGNYRKAEELWAETARLDPSWERPFYNLACATALQGRDGDALAYLQMVARREIDYRRLRKVETDPDLVSIRQRPELREILDLLAEQLLVGTYEPRDSESLFASSRGCRSFTLDPHGKYRHGCQSRYATSGEWTYARGILYVRAKAYQSDCKRKKPCLQHQVNDYDALAITRLDSRALCLERVDSGRKWPVDRELGPIVDAPRGSIASGCYK